MNALLAAGAGGAGGGGARKCADEGGGRGGGMCQTSGCYVIEADYTESITAITRSL